MSHLLDSTPNDDWLSSLRDDESPTPPPLPRSQPPTPTGARGPAPRTPKFEADDWEPFPDHVPEAPPAEYDTAERAEEEQPEAKKASPPVATPRRARTVFLSGVAGLVVGGAIAAGIAAALSRPEPRPVPPAPPEPPAPIAGADVIVSDAGKGTYTSLAEGVARAAPGSRIRVLPGVYRGGIVIDKDVEITGSGERGNIVIECTDVDAIEMKADHAVLRNLTIRAKAADGKKIHAVKVPRGRLVVEDCDLTADAAACVLVSGPEAAPEFFRCKIHDTPVGVEVAEKAGGRFVNCEVFETAQAGFLVRSEASPSVRHSQIHHSRFAGVMVVEKGRGVFDDCTIHHNAQANVQVLTEGDPLCNACTLDDSEAAGVWVEKCGLGTFTGCKVRKSKSAGVYVAASGNPRLIHCVISGGGNSGVFIRDKGIGALEDCDIVDNDLNGVGLDSSNGTTLSRCRIHRNAGSGLTATKANMQFVDIDLTGNKQGPFSRDKESDIAGTRAKTEEPKPGGTPAPKPAPAPEPKPAPAPEPPPVVKPTPTPEPLPAVKPTPQPAPVVKPEPIIPPWARIPERKPAKDWPPAIKPRRPGIDWDKVFPPAKPKPPAPTPPTGGAPGVFDPDNNFIPPPPPAPAPPPA
jgi:hypothetical protein